MKTISSKYVKVSGEFELERDLEIGNDYEIKLKGSLTEKREKDDNEGGAELTFIYKPYLGEIISESGETTKLKDKRRASQKLRGMIEFYRTEIASDMDEEEFYQGFMGKVLANFPEIVEFMKGIK